jgi:hypothetical protein
MMEFVADRLGASDDPLVQLRMMVHKAFGAASFSEFWQYWNPVYHYLLLYWVYLPLRRLSVPRPIGVVVTFAFCGFFLHDIVHVWFSRFPIVTVWFVLLGLIALFGEAHGMNVSRLSPGPRAAIHGSSLVVAFLAATALLKALN